MNIVVSHGPSYAVATALLEAGESVIAEAGAMVSMDPHVAISTYATESREAPRRRGCLGSLLSPFRRIFGGESFYQNRFTTVQHPGSVTFAPGIPGDVAVAEVSAEAGVILQNSAFLCSAEGVQIDTKWEGARGFMAGEGVFMLRAQGDGLLAFNSFGAIKEVQVEDHYVVDSGHLVAFEDSLEYDVRMFSRGIWKALFGGEAFVCEFSGRGRVWIQSRNTAAWGAMIGPKLPKRVR